MSRTCPGCDKPMLDGQVFNGLLKCHWDCQEATRAKMGDKVADDLIQYNINKRLAQEGIVPGHHLFERLGGKV